jgi:acetyltransferase-like isoleucine patch superfamily enzyme
MSSGNRLQALRRTISRRFVPGVVMTLYYFLKFRCFVHPRATVQVSRNIRFGRKTTVHPYSRIIISGGRLSIGTESNVQSFSTIAAGDSEVVIGDHVRVGPNCNLLGENHRFERRDVPIHKQGNVPKGLRIGDDVWIGSNSVILPGVQLARGCIVGAGSVVTRDVPEYVIVVGNPAKLLRER